METKIYTCPMHPEIKQSSPGQCPVCGMNLVLKSETRVSDSEAGVEESFFKTYQPLIVIIGLIFTTALVGSESGRDFMPQFMAGFFLVFGGFKLLDLKGFAQAYSTYDILARRWFSWGYIYPFVEIILGWLYLTRMTPPPVHLFTFLLMAFSGWGVLQSILQKRKFQCACLGTIIKVPLTKVTLVEDFGMAAMALLSVLV